jgi:hypothetical protein
VSGVTRWGTTGEELLDVGGGIAAAVQLRSSTGIGSSLPAIATSAAVLSSSTVM